MQNLPILKKRSKNIFQNNRLLGYLVSNIYFNFNKVDSYYKIYVQINMYYLKYSNSC